MLEQKLKVLIESGIIDESDHKVLQEVLGYLKMRGYISNNDQAETFIIHLAMAVNRKKMKELIVPIEDMTMQEIRAQFKYQDSVELWGEIQTIIKQDFYKNEHPYFILHLLNLIS